MKKPKPFNPFRSAAKEISEFFSPQQGKTATPQTASPSYVLAFSDEEFLLREELRPVRLQLELVKPELLQRDFGVQSTVVIFGSARIPSEEKAKQNVSDAEALLKKSPNDTNAKNALRLHERMLKNSYYYEQARRFAHLIAEQSQVHEGELHNVVVTGGGPGIMEAANRGAHEAGAKNIGLAIVLPKEEAPNIYITPELTFRFHYFAIRKMHFLIRARALAAFPGGYGTLDELFETLTLIQTKKISRIPVILFGREFWQRVINFDVLAEEGMINPEDLHLFHYAETAEEAFSAIEAFYKT